jgi:hypothetical protein
MTDHLIELRLYGRPDPNRGTAYLSSLCRSSERHFVSAAPDNGTWRLQAKLLPFNAGGRILETIILSVDD